MISNLSIIINEGLNFWQNQYSPLLIWWIICCGIIVVLAEIVHRLIAERQIASKAFLWKASIVVLFFLPLSYMINPLRTDIPISPAYEKVVLNLTEDHFDKQDKDERRNSRFLSENQAQIYVPMLNLSYHDGANGGINNQSGESKEKPPIGTTNSRRKTMSISGIHFAGICYVVGVVLVLSIGIWRFIRTYLFLRNTVPCEEEFVNDLVVEVTRELGIKRIIDVRLCSQQISPALSGFFHPTLILPISLISEWEKDSLKPILHHELSHIINRDHWYDFMSRVLIVFLWFFPLILWIRKRLEDTRETLCDAKAAKFCSSSHDYASLIIKLAENLLPQTSRATFSMVRNRKRMLYRFKWMLEKGDVETYCTWIRKNVIAIPLALLFMFMGGFRLISYATEQPSLTKPIDRRVKANSHPGLSVRKIERETMTSSIPTPDGRFVADCVKGDLVVREIETGEFKRLISFGTQKSVIKVKLSRDGKKIAYTVYNNENEKQELHVIDFDGSNERILSSNLDFERYHLHEWSPDGKNFLAVGFRDEEYTLLLVSSEDNTMRKIKSLGKRRSNNICFSPDGHYLAYELSNPHDSANNDIYLMRLDGSHEKPLLNSAHNERLLGWSPNDNWILYTSDMSVTNDVYAIYVKDGNVYGMPRLIKSNFGHFFHPKGFTIDGSYYYMETIYAEQLNIAEYNPDISIDIVVKDIVHVGSMKLFFAWSPDGKKLAFVKDIGSNSKVSIWSHSQQYVHDIPYLHYYWYLHWYPDNQSLLTQKETPKENSLYRIDTSTNTITPIGKNLQPDCYLGGWIEDGNSFFYGQYQEEPVEETKLIIENIKNDVKKILLKDKWLGCFEISPDRTMIAYCTRDPQDMIKVVSIDDGKTWDLANKYNNCLRWTKDSQGILYIENNYLMHLNAKIYNPEPKIVGKFQIKPSNTFEINPTENLIAFQSGHGDSKNELWVMENFLPGRPPREATKKEEDSLIPEFENALTAVKSATQSLRISETKINDNFDDGETWGWHVYEQPGRDAYHYDVKDGVLILRNCVAEIGRPDWKNYRVNVRYCTKKLFDPYGHGGIRVRISMYEGNEANYGFSPMPWQNFSCLYFCNRDWKNKIVPNLMGFFYSKISMDQWLTSQVEVINDNITCYLDGEKVIETKDDNLSQGKVAIGSHYATVWFDDFSIELLP